MEPIGSGPFEQAFTCRARKRYRCEDGQCWALIEVGEKYVASTVFPGHDVVTVDKPTIWRFCVPCATRYGRPLPPEQPRRGRDIDPEAVAIAVRGDRLVRLTVHERREVVRRLTEARLGAPEIGRRLGITARSVVRHRARIRQHDADYRLDVLV